MAHSRPIRVAHLLPYGNVRGTEQMVLNLCRLRTRSRFECMVAAPEEGIMVEEMRQCGAIVYTGTGSLSTVMAWADVINLHWCFYERAWIEAALAAGKPLVTTLHWLTVLPALPCVTICTSEYSYEIQNLKNRFVCIPNGVDLDRFSPVPRPAPAADDPVIITRVCHPEKCAFYFWTGMTRVLEQYPQVKIWIVGQTESCPSWERVQFWGVRRDIPEILARSDIFAYTPYPSHGTRDLVVLEALACGVPCVVSDVNSTRESVVDGVNGFLTPFDDVDAFVTRIGQLVENPDLRLKMGAAAAKSARERCDMRAASALYEAVYTAVLQGIHPASVVPAARSIST